MAKKATLSQLAAPVHIYPQVVVNVRVADKSAVQRDADVRTAVENAARVLGDEGRILVRESGTEPLIRVMVEAKTKEECGKIADGVVRVIQDKGYAV